MININNRKKQFQIFYNDKNYVNLLNEVKDYFSQSEENNPYLYMFDSKFSPAILFLFKEELKDLSGIYTHFTNFINNNPSEKFDYISKNRSHFLPNNTVQFLDIFSYQFKHAEALFNYKFPHSDFIDQLYKKEFNQNSEMEFYLQMLTISLFSNKDNNLSILDILRRINEEKIFDKKNISHAYTPAKGDEYFNKFKNVLKSNGNLDLLINFVEEFSNGLENGISLNNHWLDTISEYFLKNQDEPINPLLYYYSIHSRLEPELKLQAIVATESFIREKTT